MGIKAREGFLESILEVPSLALSITEVSDPHVEASMSVWDGKLQAGRNENWEGEEHVMLFGIA